MRPARPWTQTTASWPITATPAEVYAALICGDRLRQWFSEYAHVDAKVGGDFRFWGRFTPGSPGRADVAQQISVLAPNERIEFTWRLLGVDSTVLLLIASHEAGTILTVEQRLNDTLGMDREREFVDDFWRLSFANLMMHLGGLSALTRPDFSDPDPVVAHTILIEAPRAVVFAVLTQPDFINQWSGSTRAAVEVNAGTYRLGWQYEHEGRQVTGGPTSILAIKHNEYLELDWPDWRGDASVTGQRIGFTLTDAGSATNVAFTHRGFSRATDISDYGYGWIHFLSEIRRVSTEALG